MNWLYRKLRISINDNRFTLPVSVVLSLIFSGILMEPCFKNWSYISEKGLTAFFSSMMQVDITSVAVSIAIMAFFYSRTDKDSLHFAENHWRILHESNNYVLICGLILVALNGISLLFESKWLQCMTICLNVSFLFVFAVSVIVVMKRDWVRVVEENSNKNAKYVKSILSIKCKFRDLCSYLDARYSDTESYFSQVERLEFLSKGERRFLKKLNDMVDDTKIGRKIKNPDQIFEQLKDIISQLEDFSSAIPESK